MYVCMYVLFSPVKPESGIIPSGQKSFNFEHLNFPGKELNVSDITDHLYHTSSFMHRDGSSVIFPKKNKNRSH